ncbi:hypothetical protein HDV04_002266 [Boothiomyces sp. JEL0838]|nr:hypothetical protein HDV04_002266 [Boothiomyces sp. JEL0838]
MQLPPEDAAPLIYGVGITLMQFSLFGSFYVIYRVLYKWKKDRAKPITLKFPFYIAITDIFLYISCMFNYVHNVIYRKDWDGLSCKLVAAAAGFSAASNMILVASISVVVYCSTVLRRPLDLGKHDWKLMLFVFGFALMMEGIAFSSNGQSWYWCYETMYSPNKAVSIVSLVVDTTMTLCIPYILLGIFDYYNDYVIFITGVGLSSGGILNMIGFIRNEGWSYKPATVHSKSSNTRSSKVSR